jgi:hypothetical protein
LHADLTSCGYKYDSSGRLVLESKQDLRKRGMPSPDWADAMALTFSEPEGSPIPRILANFNIRHPLPQSSDRVANLATTLYLFESISFANCLASVSVGKVLVCLANTCALLRRCFGISTETDQ